MVHLSHPYKTTGKTIALTIQIFLNSFRKALLQVLVKNGRIIKPVADDKFNIYWETTDMFLTSVVK